VLGILLVARHPMHLLLTTPRQGEIWIGSIHAAGDVEVLRKNGITAMVSCASNVPVARTQNVKFLGVYDGTAIAKGNMKWYHVTAMMDAVLKEVENGGRVLFSCKNTAHRSAEVSGLELCFLTGEEPDTVMNHIRTIREMCDFDSVHPGDKRTCFNLPILTPRQFLRSKAADLAAAHDLLEPSEKMRLNVVMSPSEYEAFAAINGVSFPDQGFKFIALFLFSLSRVARP